MQDISFDDIPALQNQITEDYGPWSEPITVSQEMINQFAELTGDRQWIHTDVDRAKKESPFGGTVAHGFLTLSLLPALRPPAPPFNIVGYGSAANYGSGGLRFLSPVPAGCDVHSCSRLMAVEAKPKGTLVTTEHLIQVVGSDRPSLLYTMLVLYRPAQG